jgi:transcriptional regulator with XRE-family HTH domain
MTKRSAAPGAEEHGITMSDEQPMNAPVRDASELRGDIPSGEPNSWQQFVDADTGKVYVKAVYDPTRDPRFSPPQPNAIGKAINGRRRHLKMSQGELAKRMGVSSALVSQWENGKTRVDANDLGRLALALDTTPTTLVGTISSVGESGWFPEGSETETPRASKLEQVLLSAFRGMTDEQREMVLRVVDAIKGR